MNKIKIQNNNGAADTANVNPKGVNAEAITIQLFCQRYGLKIIGEEQIAEVPAFIVETHDKRKAYIGGCPCHCGCFTRFDELKKNLWLTRLYDKSGNLGKVKITEKNNDIITFDL